ncbi:ribosomal large subunit pseudouridine synthase D [bacterium BMS3Bbin10]|nr:ribosomal large subunit pseudouridine synthase D [bacterium BMS3Bbin10]
MSDSEPADKGQRFTIEAAAGDEGERLDRFLAKNMPDMSRSRLKALIKAGQATLDGRTIVEPNFRVKPGETYCITVPPAQPAIPKGENIPLDVVYEDDWLIVIDKPAGLVVHPAAGNWSGTLVHALIHHCGGSLSGVGGVKRPGIVHRIDKETSGLMVVAKSDAAHRALAEQFADHGRTGPLERSYEALVWGIPHPPKGTIDAALGRKPQQRQKMGVLAAGGKQAVTHYEVLETFGPAKEPVASRVRCRLETGRTHQIRVHMAHIGNPLIGDPLYGTGFRTKARILPDGPREAVEKLLRQALHATLLGFAHPKDKQAMRFESALPEDISRVLKSLSEV